LRTMAAIFSVNSARVMKASLGLDDRNQAIGVPDLSGRWREPLPRA